MAIFGELKILCWSYPKAMEKIVKSTNLSQMNYTPYFLAWNVHLQGIVFGPYTAFHENLFTVKYHRELFSLSDGEKIALDWFKEPADVNTDE